MKLIRQYLLYVATSRTGFIESTLSIYTMEQYTRRFLSAVEWYQMRPIDIEIRQQVLWWVAGPLRLEASLHNKVKSKPIARMPDVRILLRTLYSGLSLCSFGTMRSVLYLNLFINLAIDSCGRIGEIVPSSKAPPEQCLVWDNIEFWVKPPLDGETTPRFYAIVNFIWLKGKRLDPGEYKKICPRLLSPKFAFEDSLRLLLYVALIEGHFKDISSWDGLRSLVAHPNGSLIRIKDESKNLPVLRGIDSNCVLWDSPMSEGAITHMLARLGRMAGFIELLTRQVAWNRWHRF